MRKKVIILTLIILFTVTAILIITTLFTQEPKEEKKYKSFDLNNYEYQHAIENFPPNKNYGEIKNIEEEKDIIYEIWEETFTDLEIDKSMPIEILYDKKEKAWLIRGTLPSGYHGGVPNILIREESGEVLAVWHTM